MAFNAWQTVTALWHVLGVTQIFTHKEFRQLRLNTTSQFLLVGLGHVIFMAAILTPESIEYGTA